MSQTETPREFESADYDTEEVRRGNRATNLAVFWATVPAVLLIILLLFFLNRRIHPPQLVATPMPVVSTQPMPVPTISPAAGLTVRYICFSVTDAQFCNGVFQNFGYHCGGVPKIEAPVLGADPQEFLNQMKQIAGGEYQLYMAGSVVTDNNGECAFTHSLEPAELRSSIVPYQPYDVRIEEKMTLQLVSPTTVLKRYSHGAITYKVTRPESLSSHHRVTWTKTSAPYKVSGLEGEFYNYDYKSEWGYGNKYEDCAFVMGQPQTMYRSSSPEGTPEFIWAISVTR